MIRKKDKYQVRKKVGPYYISTVNLECILLRGHKLMMGHYPMYPISTLMKTDKEMMGWWETMVKDTVSNEWIEQIRYKYKHRALDGHAEMIKKYENIRNNNRKEKQPETTEQE